MRLVTTLVLCSALTACGNAGLEPVLDPLHPSLRVALKGSFPGTSALPVSHPRIGVMWLIVDDHTPKSYFRAVMGQSVPLAQPLSDTEMDLLLLPPTDEQMTHFVADDGTLSTALGVGRLIAFDDLDDDGTATFSGPFVIGGADRLFGASWDLMLRYWSDAPLRDGVAAEVSSSPVRLFTFFWEQTRAATHPGFELAAPSLSDIFGVRRISPDPMSIVAAPLTTDLTLDHPLWFGSEQFSGVSENSVDSILSCDPELLPNHGAPGYAGAPGDPCNSGFANSHQGCAPVCCACPNGDHRAFSAYACMEGGHCADAATACHLGAGSACAGM